MKGIYLLGLFLLFFLQANAQPCGGQSLFQLGGNFYPLVYGVDSAGWLLMGPKLLQSASLETEWQFQYINCNGTGPVHPSIHFSNNPTGTMNYQTNVMPTEEGGFYYLSSENDSGNGSRVYIGYLNPDRSVDLVADVSITPSQTYPPVGMIGTWKNNLLRYWSDTLFVFDKQNNRLDSLVISSLIGSASLHDSLLLMTDSMLYKFDKFLAPVDSAALNFDRIMYYETALIGQKNRWLYSLSSSLDVTDSIQLPDSARAFTPAPGGFLVAWQGSANNNELTLAHYDRHLNLVKGYDTDMHCTARISLASNDSLFAICGSVHNTCWMLETVPFGGEVAHHRAFGLNVVSSDQQLQPFYADSLMSILHVTLANWGSDTIYSFGYTYSRSIVELSERYWARTSDWVVATLLPGDRLTVTDTAYFISNEPVFIDDDHSPSSYFNIGAENDLPSYDCMSWNGTPLAVNIPPKHSEIKLYPNPAKGLVQIASNGQLIEAVRIYNLQGQLLLNTEPAKINPTLDLHQLDAGCYLVQLQTKSSTQSLKLVKY